MSEVIGLSTGAEARMRNDVAPIAAVLLNGGTAKPVPGTWSATSELLARELSPRFPGIAFTEVRYRVRSWNELGSCMADARATLDVVARPTLLVGFSMGGAVSLGVAGHPLVEGVVGLAPWIPERLSLEGLRGKRLDVIHGSWDRYLPGIPGVSPASSRRGFERARALGASGTYALIPGGVHGAALRTPFGSIYHLPRWRSWVDLVGERLSAFEQASRPRPG